MNDEEDMMLIGFSGCVSLVLMVVLSRFLNPSTCFIIFFLSTFILYSGIKDEWI